ncbi:scarecrow-like protein 9 [Cynara cardunculus var. scolymus]|uniref:Transcription factor GRAS n=1 Tax=Cynara cardunculus var. scolymus TaxID=59895 RepID=A0A118K1U9_CYNCS|nr:scarecrow-like protein 9 [Cynara cardunculus var. scolymus]KVI03363.1 Transcription factor GRAS [Cynara cardunculus var. scolymus]
MDPRIRRFASSANGNGIKFGNQSITAKALDNPPRFENACSVYDPVNGNLDSVSVYDHNFRGIQFDRNFRGIQFDPPTSSSLVVSADELHEDCDLSDAILGYISQVLMEEDMEDKSCMLYESLDLQAAEKSFYDVLGKKYPPSPSYDEGLLSVDRYIESPSDYSSLDQNTYVGEFTNGSGYLHHESNLQSLGANDVSCRSVSSSNSGNNVIDGFIDSPARTFQAPEICDENQMMLKFNKGVEEANKFLPSDNKLLASFNGGESWPKVENSKGGELMVMVDGRNLQTWTRVRKSPCGEDDIGVEERSIKQAAIYQDSTLRSKEIDLILLCSQGQGDVALRSLRYTLQKETSKDKLKDKEPKCLTKGKGKGKGRSRKQKNTKEVIDLRTLLITCAQAIAADDRRNANELLKKIRQHASPFGDGSQRLAHCFADGLEARLAGTGSQIYRALVSKKTSATDYIKAYHLYIASSPFRKISNFASNRTIRDMAVAENATRIHIIDFGIHYGFQWPTFIQRILEKEGGPPRIRLTGIEFPQPGFRPAERIEETGLRLKEYASHFNVPFEYNPIAKRWEDVSVEDLKIDEGEFLVVNCMYRSKNLLDETVGVDSARNVVLDLIKKISPDIFIHGILNGSYNAPFFVTRFREALFHFSALFDMLETNVPRERSERMLLERELFGREALNVIACEGSERVERPETYKQWHARNLRAGLVSFPFSREIIKMAREKVGLYHKDFMIDVDNQWLLLGWKGRIIYAISCWKVE